MNRCILCNKDKRTGDIQDILFGDDPLCFECRKKWERKIIRYRINGIQGEASYVYNDAFSKCLIQFKEMKDEALQDVFLYEVKNRLKRKYKGYTILLLPSSSKKIKERGFHHLQEMFACIGLQMSEPFEKIDDLDQKMLHKKDREKMAYGIRLKEGVHLPKKILLCDDTITTGSTMKGALHCLNRNHHTIRMYTVSANSSWI
ncbi:MAG: hypothetical protein IKR11_12825 [Solobacterium sp.]|nr:hypothetical protein [Solobacterium sp.]